MSILSKIWGILKKHHGLISSLIIISMQFATFVVFVYRNTANSPLGYTTTFNGFLFVALTFFAAFVATFAIARYAIARKISNLRALFEFVEPGELLHSECEKAAQSINSGIGLCGISLWTIMLVLCFVALDLSRPMIIPFLLLYFIGLFLCTDGVRTFNRMLNFDVSEELMLSVACALKTMPAAQISTG